ncbi:MAG: hypothetical protein AB2827_12370 [Candidatus Thiodiazotropha sp.]
MVDTVKHYTAGEKAWQVGPLGYFVSPRGITLVGIITLASTLAVGLLSYEVFPHAVVKLSLLFIIAPIALGSTLMWLLYYLRIRSVRSLGVKHSLHQLTHDVRDANTRLWEKLTKEPNFSVEQINKEITYLLTTICNNASIHFQLLTNNKFVGIAIRLVAIREADGALVYKTVARSKNLNKDRELTSEAIEGNSGIPGFFTKEKPAQGILIYYDVKEAIQEGTYTKTKNDELFPGEVATLMVAPLNAWSGIKEDIIGLMYVTSPNKGTFDATHIDALAFMADLTAAAISNTVEIASLMCGRESSEGGCNE